MKRIGQMIQLRPEKAEGCQRLDVKIWEGFDRIMRDAKIRNYTIFQKDCFLFAYFEYVGEEKKFEDYMEQMWNAPRMQEWLYKKQMPLEGQTEKWWENMEIVFQQDVR